MVQLVGASFLWLHLVFLFWLCSALPKVLFNAIILNSGTQVSDQDLSALGQGIKELRSLTNLSLDLRYLNYNYFLEFKKPFCKVLIAFWGDLFVVKFCFFILLCRARQNEMSPF